VGILFLAAAAMFHFSKKVPPGISEEKIEPLFLVAIKLILLL